MRMLKLFHESNEAQENTTAEDSEQVAVYA